MEGLWGALVVAGANILAQIILWAKAAGAAGQRQIDTTQDIRRLEGKIDKLDKEVRKHETLLARIAERIGLGPGSIGSNRP